MTVPVSTCGATTTVSGAVVSCAVVAVISLLTGCGATLPGQPSAEPTVVTRYVNAELRGLLPDSSQFPARYPSVVLPPEAAAQAEGDLTGITRGAAVAPDGCAPGPRATGPDRTAVAVGTDNDTRATLTVVLTRTTERLSVLREQLRRCGEIRATRGGAATTIRTELRDAPSADADDTLALARTVRPDTGGAGLTQSMRTLTAQVGDVRITVTYMTFSEGTPDTAALGELFTTAVRKVNTG